MHRFCTDSHPRPPNPTCMPWPPGSAARRSALLHALLPPVLRCCRAGLPAGEYAAAAAAAVGTVRDATFPTNITTTTSTAITTTSDQGTQGQGQQGSEGGGGTGGAIASGGPGRSGPVSLAASPAVREAVALLMAVEEHVVAAVQYDAGELWGRGCPPYTVGPARCKDAGSLLTAPGPQ